MPNTDLNKPRCPVCNHPLGLHATVVADVMAHCSNCQWEWRGGDE